MLAATDRFIASLAEMRTDLDEMRKALNIYEGDMREFRKVAGESLGDRDVSDDG